jgi:hypothetical protein
LKGREGGVAQTTKNPWFSKNPPKTIMGHEGSAMMIHLCNIITQTLLQREIEKN